MNERRVCLPFIVHRSAWTVYRRLSDPDFCRRLQQLRAEMVQRTAGMLTAAAGEGVQALLALVKEGTPPAVRLGAAASKR